MKAVFLGTGSMVPTAQRNHSAIFLTYKNEGLLFDCGEGTQRQFRIGKIKPTKITKILISHWHGDHVLGLPGLIQTLGANEYSGILEIYGPEGTKQRVKQMLGSFIMEEKVRLKVSDVGKGIFYEDENFALEAIPLSHSTPCLAYAFIEKDKRKIDLAYLKKYGLKKHPVLKQLQQGRDIEWQGKKIKAEKATLLKRGRKFVYIADTVLCENAIRIAKDADVLVSESTLEGGMEEKAGKIGHMTCCQAAEIAKRANAKKLVLTHFSQRYKSVSELKKQAKKIFPKTEAAKDFMEIVI